MRVCWRGRCAGVRRLISCMRRRARRVRSANPRRALRHVRAETLDQPGEDADRIPEQRVVGGEMDVGLDDGGVDAELGAVLEAEPDGGLDDGVVEGADGGRREPQKGAIEGVVLGHGLGVEGREAPQRVAVGDALAQFAEIPGLDPLEHEGAEHLGGVQAVAPRPRAPEPAHQIGVDERDERLLMGVEKVGEGLHGRLQRDPLGLQFEIGEAEGAGPRSHRARRRWAIRKARCAADIAWISSLRRWHSATHAATSLRQAMGTYSVQVFCCSFQVNSAVSWRGPSVAHRHVGRPHRLVLMVRDPSRKGPIVRSRVRIRWPAGLVASARAMGKYTYYPPPRQQQHFTMLRARLGTIPRPGVRALGDAGPAPPSWHDVARRRTRVAAILAAFPPARPLSCDGSYGR